MIRLLALSSYVYQSAAAIVLIFATSHLLAPSEYAHFSLTIAASQLLCVFAFEWLQLAGVRFLAASQFDDAARQRGSLVAAALISALALLAAATIAVAVGLPRDAAKFAIVLALLQGFTELAFTIIRVDGRLGTAGLLLTLRATLLLAGAAAGALLGGSSHAAMLGSSLGYAVSLGTGLLVFRVVLRAGTRIEIVSDLRAFARYGLLAAGASVVHLAVPVSIRFLVVGGLAADAAAGFSIAIDLLQRPFAVLVAAIHSVNYPDVVYQFERGSARASREETAHLFDFLACSTAVMLGGVIGFLPDAARIFVPNNIIGPFLGVAPAAAMFYFAHVHLQSTLAVVPHLQKSALRLLVIALCQFTVVSALSATALRLGYTPADVMWSAAGATATIGILACRPTLAFAAYPTPSLLVVAALAALVIASLSVVGSVTPTWLAAKVAIAGLTTAIVALRGDFVGLHRGEKRASP